MNTNVFHICNSDTGNGQMVALEIDKSHRIAAYRSNHATTQVRYYERLFCPACGFEAYRRNDVGLNGEVLF